MNGRERFNRRLLDLLGEHGVVEIIVALRDRGGSATFGELQGELLARPAPVLRSLAAAGQVRRIGEGTWDSEPPPNARFMLTEAGAGLAETLDELERWATRNIRETDQREHSYKIT